MANMSKVKQYTFYIFGALMMMSSTLSTFGIANITPALLQKFNAMQHYTLTSLMASFGMLICLPIVGKLIDGFGRKPILIIGGTITLISSFATAFATNFVIFIVMRSLISVGIACLTPIPSSTLPFVFERSKLPQLYGIQGAFLALGTFFGSMIAGFFSDLGFAWIAVAYPGIIAAVSTIVLLILCPDVPRKPLPYIDFGGIGLLFCVMAAIVYASSFGTRIGWGNPFIIGAIALMIVAFIGFINLEKKVKSPLVNLSLFKNPVFSGAILCCFFMTWYQTTMRVYAPLMIQNVMRMSAAVSGSILLPRSILNIVFPAFCGAWVSKNQSDRYWKGLFITGLFISIGNLMLCFSSSTTPLMIFYIGLGLTGIAESFKQASLVPALQSTLTAENMGSGMSLNSMIGTLGSTVSACLYGIVFDAIAPDPGILPKLTTATNTVFMVSTATGLCVCMLAFLLVKPKTLQGDTAAA